MAICPECDEEVPVDEYDVDMGDTLSCPECGSNLVVASVNPIELDLAPDDEDEDEDDEDEDDDLDDDDDLDGDEDDDDGEKDDEGWDE